MKKDIPLFPKKPALKAPAKEDTLRHPKVKELFIRNFFTAHPVLIRGLALAPAMIATTDARNSVILTACLFWLTLFPTVFATLVRDKLPKFLRVPCYVLLASLAYIPAFLFLSSLSYPAYTNLGIFLPTMVVSSFVYAKAEKESRTLPLHLALLDTLLGCLSFGFFVFLLGSLREIAGSGHFFGIPLNVPTEPGVLLPFAGFLLVGLLSALYQFLIRRFNRNKRAEEQSAREDETGGEE